MNELIVWILLVVLPTVLNITKAMLDHAETELVTVTQRNATIEECARTAEEFSPSIGHGFDRVAAAIRALKDKP